jgi:hypothetical protein
MVVVIKFKGQLDLMQIRFTPRIGPLVARRIQARQDDGGQDPDDGNDNEKLDKSEALLDPRMTVSRVFNTRIVARLYPASLELVHTLCYRYLQYENHC